MLQHDKCKAFEVVIEQQEKKIKELEIKLKTSKALLKFYLPWSKELVQTLVGVYRLDAEQMNVMMKARDKIKIDIESLKEL